MRQDFVIKTKVINEKNVPYCFFDSDLNHGGAGKQIMAAPCTTIASIGDGREHFFHRNSTGLFTGKGYRLTKRRHDYTP